jgi:hypothetical protein
VGELVDEPWGAGLSVRRIEIKINEHFGLDQQCQIVMHVKRVE